MHLVHHVLHFSLARLKIIDEGLGHRTPLPTESLCLGTHVAALHYRAFDWVWGAGEGASVGRSRGGWRGGAEGGEGARARHVRVG